MVLLYVRLRLGLGQDRFGLWADIAVNDVRQRLRWILPGQFLMDSPEDEPGRKNDEGPQHSVTLSRGYWLFDTPCTQALWQAVMGDNLSKFQSPDRPVENVSWDDVQTFLARLRDDYRLELALPSEAQWEYACRAGTTTAIHTGPLEILSTRNAPALDPIAWYGGNSGVDYELEEGENSKNWPNKQYPHEKVGTHPVGRKGCNPWGLHDMLGNVWEWCADGWHKSYEGAPADGQAWVVSANSTTDRVIRGGSWTSYADYVRAASRGLYLLDTRFDHLGFRCARVQS